MNALLNKSDKFSSGKRKAALLQVKKYMAEFARTATVQTFSGLKNEGIPELSSVLNSWFFNPDVDGFDDPEQELSDLE